MNTKQPSTEIKNALRRRIIMHVGGDTLTLHEGKIASQFGVSRTPVRQVLQSLAAEALVEVRSGVGSIATPLHPERRERDVEALAAFLRGCSPIATDTALEKVRVEMIGLQSVLNASKLSKLDETYFDSAERLLACLTTLVNDRVLEDALVACFWRYIRRRIAENGADADKMIKEMTSVVNDAIYGADSGDVANVFKMVSAAL